MRTPCYGWPTCRCPVSKYERLLAPPMRLSTSTTEASRSSRRSKSPSPVTSVLNSNMGAKSTVWRARVLERRLPPTLIPCRRAVVLYTSDRPPTHIERSMVSCILFLASCWSSAHFLTTFSHAPSSIWISGTSWHSEKFVFRSLP